MANKNGRKTGSLAERLLAKRNVTESGCWEFTGHINNRGYGLISKGGRSQKLMLCHRASYESFVGPIPEGKIVLHKCDNTKCFNPDHLSVGTQQDNMDDMASKGRRVSLYGTDSPNAKLSSSQVAEIRSRYVPRVNTSELAKEFGVTRQYVWQLGKGMWRSNG
jgi:hypothetical protein